MQSFFIPGEKSMISLVRTSMDFLLLSTTPTTMRSCFPAAEITVTCGNVSCARYSCVESFQGIGLTGMHLGWDWPSSKALKPLKVRIVLNSGMDRQSSRRGSRLRRVHTTCGSPVSLCQACPTDHFSGSSWQFSLDWYGMLATTSA